MSWLFLFCVQQEMSSTANIRTASTWHRSGVSWRVTCAHTWASAVTSAACVVAHLSRRATWWDTSASTWTTSRSSAGSVSTAARGVTSWRSTPSNTTAPSQRWRFPSSRVSPGGRASARMRSPGCRRSRQRPRCSRPTSRSNRPRPTKATCPAVSPRIPTTHSPTCPGHRSMSRAGQTGLPRPRTTATCSTQRVTPQGLPTWPLSRASWVTKIRTLPTRHRPLFRVRWRWCHTRSPHNTCCHLGGGV